MKQFSDNVKDSCNRFFEVQDDSEIEQRESIHKRKMEETREFIAPLTPEEEERALQERIAKCFPPQKEAEPEKPTIKERLAKLLPPQVEFEDDEEEQGSESKRHAEKKEQLREKRNQSVPSAAAKVHRTMQINVPIPGAGGSDTAQNAPAQRKSGALEEKTFTINISRNGSVKRTAPTETNQSKKEEKAMKTAFAADKTVQMQQPRTETPVSAEKSKPQTDMDKTVQIQLPRTERTVISEKPKTIENTVKTMHGNASDRKAAAMHEMPKKQESAAKPAQNAGKAANVPAMHEMPKKQESAAKPAQNAGQAANVPAMHEIPKKQESAAKLAQNAGQAANVPAMHEMPKKQESAAKPAQNAGKAANVPAMHEMPKKQESVTKPAEAIDTVSEASSEFAATETTSAPVKTLKDAAQAVPQPTPVPPSAASEREENEAPRARIKGLFRQLFKTDSFAAPSAVHLDDDLDFTLSKSNVTQSTNLREVAADERLAELYRIAEDARANAYAPYSHFKVGAALVTREGKIYTGVNVENASYSMTMCAERSALFSAVSQGERDFVAIAISGGAENGDTTAPCFPCGACRQALAEFCNDRLLVVLSDGVYRLQEFLPYPFRLSENN